MIPFIKRPKALTDQAITVKLKIKQHCFVDYYRYLASLGLQVFSMSN